MSQQRPGIAVACAVAAAACLLAGPPARADLDEYVKAADPSFAWSVTGDEKADAGRVVRIALTSQTWRGGAWTHQLQVYEPAGVKASDAVLLFITGGNSQSRPGPRDAETGFALARACGARVAVLPQVPNQPILGNRSEDDAIAETFVKYLKDGDETWPLLFPMVKSAVRAMDAVQQWAEKDGHPAARFVVTGASKRGWTTWLTAAVDRRVLAIAPMVIPTLNMRAQNKHQIDSWGKYSDQIADYTRRGLTEKIDTPEGTKLWKMIDPFTYRDRYTMPKLIINGTNDPYWTVDSLNLFWDELPPPKHVVYLPNAGHGLDQHRDYATNGVGALFRHAVAGTPLPKMTWTHADNPDDAPILTIRTEPAAKAARLWTATAPDLDFRPVPWTAADPLPTGGEFTFVAERPDRGKCLALFGDLTYEVDGLEYHLSTQIRVVDRRPKQP